MTMPSAYCKPILLTPTKWWFTRRMSELAQNGVAMVKTRQMPGSGNLPVISKIQVEPKGSVPCLEALRLVKIPRALRWLLG